MVIVGVLFIIVDFVVINKLELIFFKELEKCNKLELEWWMKYWGFLFKKLDIKV